MVFQILNTILICTVSATVKNFVRSHAMTDDAAITMRASWRKRMDGTLKTVEYMRLAVQIHFKTFIVFVSAYFTCAGVPIASK